MDEKRRTAIRILQSTIYDGRRTLSKLLGSAQYTQISYTKSAAQDLLDEIADNPYMPVIRIVEKYREQMEEYSYVSPDFGIIYSIKYDYATYVLDCLLN